MTLTVVSKQKWQTKKLRDVCGISSSSTLLKAHKDYYENVSVEISYDERKF